MGIGGRGDGFAGHHVDEGGGCQDDTENDSAGSTSYDDSDVVGSSGCGLLCDEGGIVGGSLSERCGGGLGQGGGQ
jgi:hypothetical protein